MRMLSTDAVFNMMLGYFFNNPKPYNLPWWKECSYSSHLLAGWVEPHNGRGDLQRQDDAKTQGQLEITWGSCRRVKRRREPQGSSSGHRPATPCQKEFLGLDSQLRCSRLTTLVAGFCPGIASFCSSTSFIQQCHLWICQLPNTLPIHVFYASFNELILIIFSWETWLELGQL